MDEVDDTDLRLITLGLVSRHEAIDSSSTCYMLVVVIAFTTRYFITELNEKTHEPS